METTYRGLVLDPFQVEAMEAIERGENVIVAAPTGAGKTLIAHYALESALEAGRRVIYTAPIKALSNQKYRDLSAAYGRDVGISTGDVSIDAGAPAVIMTTEIFRNTIFEDPERLEEVAWVIFDEVHYLDDPDRGTVWEESLIFAPPSIRVLALSATVSNLDELAAWVGEARGSPVHVVKEERRPVPLEVFVASTEGGIKPVEKVKQLRARSSRRAQKRRQRDYHAYLEGAWADLVEQIARRDELPCLFFLFSRVATEKLAELVAEDDYTASADEREAGIAEFRRLVDAFELDRRDPEVERLEYTMRSGVGYHHAGILPALKEVIERLFTSGYVRVLCATETFALGVNMPARSVAFEGIRKFNGVARVPLKTREFQQMAGRAGRRGIDARGAVYLTFDPHREDPHVYLSLVNGRVEPVASQFNLSYGTLISLWERLGERIYEACERSFANFKARARRGQGRGKGRRRRGVHHDRPLGGEPSAWEREVSPGGRVRGPHVVRGRGRGRHRRSRPEPPPAGVGPRRYADVVQQVRLKLRVLRELGYIGDGGEVTDRGRFAMQNFGHELEVSELVFRGVLDHLRPDQLAVVGAAVVFESRRGVYYGGDDPRGVLGKPVYRKANQAIRDLWQLEVDLDIRPPVKPLDWGLTGITHHWAEGGEFQELRDLTDASDGDLVRTLRQTIQLLRLMGGPLRELGREELARSVAAAQRLLKRGLVDAEWQLRRGAELEAERLEAEEEEGEGEGPDA